MTESEKTPGARMGAAIMKGVLIGLPVTLVGLSLAIWLITDESIGTSIVTAILPGILLGVFGGGFAGMASTMEE